MKTTKLIILLLATVITVGILSANAAYFTSDFESGWDGWTSVGSATLSTANPYAGTNSVHFGQGAGISRNVSGTGELGTLTEYFYVKAGTLDMGFELKASNSSTAESVFFRNLRWEPASGQPEPAQHWHFEDNNGVSQYYLLSAGWHRIVIEFTATGYTFQLDGHAALTGTVMSAGVTDFNIGDVWWAGVGCDGTYVDDIVWAAPGATLVGSSFTSDFEPGLWDGWTPVGSATLSTANPHAGAYSVHFGKGAYIRRNVSTTGDLGTLTEWFFVKAGLLDMGFEVMTAKNTVTSETVYFRNLVWEPPTVNPTQPTQYWHFEDNNGVSQYYLIATGWHKIVIEFTATGYTFQLDTHAALTGTVMSAGITDLQIGDSWWAGAGVGCDGTYIDDITWIIPPPPAGTLLIIN